MRTTKNSKTPSIALNDILNALRPYRQRLTKDEEYVLTIEEINELLNEHNWTDDDVFSVLCKNGYKPYFCDEAVGEEFVCIKEINIQDVLDMCIYRSSIFDENGDLIEVNPDEYRDHETWCEEWLFTASMRKEILRKYPNLSYIAAENGYGICELNNWKYVPGEGVVSYDDDDFYSIYKLDK